MIWIIAFTWLALSALTLLFIAGAHAAQRPELVEVSVAAKKEGRTNGSRPSMQPSQAGQRAYPSSSAILPYDVAIHSPSDSEQAS